MANSWKRKSEEQLSQLKEQTAGNLNMIIGFVIFGVFPLIVSIILFLTNHWRIALPFMTLAVIIFIISIYIAVGNRGISKQIKQIFEDLNYEGVSENEKKAGELLNAQQLELAEYYTSIRHQHSMIFCVGIVCIFCGFAIIGVALLFIASLAGVTPFAFMDSWVTEKGSSVLSEQIILGALGAISGILTNYIAIIYLGVYSKAVESLNRFHGRLVIHINCISAIFLHLK